MTNDNLKRNSSILLRKFFNYLLPSMLTMAAMSLSEFVDSMVVSNLLGKDAMAIVQMGFPITLIAAAAYTLIGSGGSILYTIALGERESKKAGTIFGLCAIASLVVGILILALEGIFFQPLAGLLCKDAQLLVDFKGYLFSLMFSTPFFVVILSLVSFLAPSGSPGLATAINVIANVVNILMDYVYINVFGMGVKGAAWATLTGYLAATVFALIALKIKPVAIKKRMPGIEDIGLIAGICSSGLPFAVSQLGFAIKFAFCNNLAGSLGGTEGIVAFSLCVQSLSVISIFMSAVFDAGAPLVAMLHGQKDYQGERKILSFLLIVQFIFSALCAGFFIFFPKYFAMLYDIRSGTALDLAITALRIFSLTYFIRGAYLVFMKYLQVLGKDKYAMFISIFDGFGGIIPISAAMCAIFGLKGLWWTFPLTSLLLFVICIIVNAFIAKRSEGRLNGILLSESDPSNAPLLDVTVLEDGGEIADVSKTTQEICEKAGLDPKLALKTALLLEELAVFTRNRIGKNGYMDMLIRVYDERIEIDCRSMGETGSIEESSEKDMAENITVLRSVADSMDYDVIMGMTYMQVLINT